MIFLRNIWIAALLLLVACSAPPTATPQATLHPLSIAITPGLKPLETAIDRCGRSNPQVALVVNEIPASALSSYPADLAIRLGPPPGEILSASPLASEEIAVIVHPSNPVEELARQSLHALFSGAVETWEELNGKAEPAAIWVLPPGDESRQAFDAVILAGSPISPNAFLAPDAENMRKAVAADPSAIGYLPSAWLAEDIRRVELNQELAASLQLPVLALAPEEPSGLPREFLLCLQSGEGQELILQRYSPYTP